MEWDYFFQFECGCGRWPDSYGLLCSLASFFIFHHTHTHNLFIIFYIEVQTMRFACQNMIFHFLFTRSFEWNEQMYLYINLCLNFSGRTQWCWWRLQYCRNGFCIRCSYEWMSEWSFFFVKLPIIANTSKYPF